MCLALILYFNVQERERQSNIPPCDVVMDWLKIYSIFLHWQYSCVYVQTYCFEIIQYQPFARTHLVWGYPVRLRGVWRDLTRTGRVSVTVIKHSISNEGQKKKERNRLKKETIRDICPKQHNIWTRQSGLYKDGFGPNKHQDVLGASQIQFTFLQISLTTQMLR